MTREEAITYLEDAKIKFKIPKAAVTARKTNEALDMAIEALEQERILKIKTVTNVEEAKAYPINTELTCEGCKFEDAIGGFCDDCCRKYGDMYAERRGK
jgi:hypothetical protein